MTDRRSKEELEFIEVLFPCQAPYYDGEKAVEVSELIRRWRNYPRHSINRLLKYTMMVDDTILIKVLPVTSRISDRFF